MYRILLIRQPFPPCCSKSKDDDLGHSCLVMDRTVAFTVSASVLSLGMSPSLFPGWKVQSGPSGRGFFISQPYMINWTSVRSETADPPSFPAVYLLYKQLITCSKWNALGGSRLHFMKSLSFAARFLCFCDCSGCSLWFCFYRCTVLEKMADEANKIVQNAFLGFVASHSFS